MWSTVASCPHQAEAALAALPPLRPTGGAHEIAELISLIETGEEWSR
jgi:hypothetical protein